MRQSESKSEKRKTKVGVSFFRPETRDLVVSRLKIRYKLTEDELVSVAKEWDDLRLGVKG